MNPIFIDHPQFRSAIRPILKCFLLLAIFAAAGILHAATCDAASLNGTYGYTFSGFFFDSFGNLNFFSSSGHFTADGQGNLTGIETDSFSGTIVRGATFTGTYTVNPDCSGSYTTNSSAVGGPFTYDFVLTDAGNGLQVVEADDSTNITGTARKQ